MCVALYSALDPMRRRDPTADSQPTGLFVAIVLTNSIAYEKQQHSVLRKII